MCCPSNKVIKTDTKRFLNPGGLHENKLCDTLQALAPINVKTVHHTSLLHIENNLDRLRLLSLTQSPRPQQKNGHISLQPFFTNKPNFLKTTRHAEIRKIEIPIHGSRGFKQAKLAREPTASRPKLCASLKNFARILPVRRSLLVLIEKKQTVVRDQLFP